MHNRNKRVAQRRCPPKISATEHKLNLLIQMVGNVTDVLILIYKRGVRMMARFDDLEREVNETEGAHESAIVAIKGLRDEIAALKAQMENPADASKIEELVKRLDEAQARLAAAIASPGDGGGSTGGVGSGGSTGGV